MDAPNLELDEVRDTLVRQMIKDIYIDEIGHIKKLGLKDVDDKVAETINQRVNDRLGDYIVKQGHIAFAELNETLQAIEAKKGKSNANTSDK